VVFVKRICTLAWLAVAAAIVALAVALSVARLMLPGMSDYRDELESALAEVLQRDVQIASLDAEWRALSPVLALNGVRIPGAGPDGGDLSIDKIQVALDPWRSLLRQRWSLRGVYLVGASLSVRRDADGSLSFVSGGNAAGSAMPLLELLLQQPLIGLQQVQLTLIDDKAGGIRRTFRDVEILLANEGVRHRFSVQSVLPPSLGERFRLIGDLKGKADDPASLRGRLYLEVSAVELREWLEYLPEPPAAGGRLDAELWAEIRDGHLTRISGQLDGRQLVLAGRDDAESVGLARLGGRLDWQRTWAGWRITVDRMRLAVDEAAGPPDIAFSAEWRQTGRRLRGVLDHLPVAEVSRLFLMLPLVPDSAKDMIGRLRPAGQLHDIRFDARLPAGQAPRVSARARFEDLSIQPAGSLPGVAGLAGFIEGSLLRGELRLDTSRARLSAPGLFRAPLAFDYLHGTVAWQRFGDRLRLQAGSLQARTADTELAARLQLDWLDEQAAPWLDLQVATGELPLARVPAYLPVGIMPSRAVAWFDDAFRAGVVDNSRFMVQGPLDRLPFDHGEGVVAAAFDFSDVQLAYHPHWGWIDDLDGHGHLSGRSLLVVGDHGYIRQAPVERIVARIDNMAKPVLKVTGTAGGTLAGMLDFVRSSPLGARFGKLVSGLESSGDAHLTLDLGIPLKRGLGRVTVAGSVDLAGNELAGPTWGFALTGITGTLNFTERGLTCKGVQARFDGAPVEVSIYPDNDDDGRRGTMIDVEGRLGVVRRLKQARWWPAEHVEGAAEWRALLFVSAERVAGKPPLRLQLLSDLKGIRLALPAPLGKSADETRAFSVQWVPGAATAWPVRIQAERLVDMVLKLDGEPARLEAAGIHFGEGGARLPPQREIHLSGRLPRASPLEWAALFDKGGDVGRRMPAPVFDLEVDMLDVFRHQVRAVRLKSRPADPWALDLAGEGAEGSLRLVFGADRRLRLVDLDLSRLVVQSASPDAETTDRRERASRGAAASPELRVAVSDLNWDGRALGALALDARRSGRGLEFQRLSVRSRALTLEGRGEWTDSDGREFTRLSAQLLDGDLGKLLRLAGDHGSVDGGRLQGGFDITWPGSPADFALERLEGELRLEVRDGRLKDVRPGAGKLLGLLNLQSIPRRLSLDFSDLFKEGFSFDKMRGTFLLADGDVYTNNLRIEAPSADIEIAGRTDLVKREYDELVTVIPHVTSGLPVAGVIAGGPAVGAAVLLAERLLSKKVEQMSKVQYVVTGSWDNPVYQRLDEQSPAAADESED